MRVKIGIVGCLGRMGRLIISELLNGNMNDAELVGAVARSGDKNVGNKVSEVLECGNVDVKITDSISSVFDISDIVIDFSTRNSTLECLNVAVKKNKPLVSGTTGLQDIDLECYGKRIPLLWSANMSIGINLLSKMVEETARKLKDEYDIEIWEMHHSAKKDAPSGTAIMLGKAAARGLEKDFKINQYIHNIQEERLPGSIGFAVSRGGGVVGDHNVMFVNSNERLELKHMAMNRSIFAKGAIKAALWLYNKPTRLYSMFDVLS